MASATFKRNKVIKSIQKYTQLANVAQKEWKDYEMLKRTAGGDNPQQYYSEMACLYQGKCQSLRMIVGDLKYEYGIEDSELAGEGEGEGT